MTLDLSVATFAIDAATWVELIPAMRSAKMQEEYKSLGLILTLQSQQDLGVFENISEKDYIVKKNILKLFESQQDAPYFKDKTIDSFHHNFLCNKKGLSIVESYRIVEGFQK